MILVGIDIGKDSHFFSIVRKEDGEVLAQPKKFTNSSQGFKTLTDSFIPFDKDKILIGMEDTGHYHFALLKHLLDRKFNVALINPTATDYTRKMNGSISKNDRLDTITICDVLSSNKPKKPYRISKFHPLICTNKEDLQGITTISRKRSMSIPTDYRNVSASSFRSTTACFHLNIAKSISMF